MQPNEHDKHSRASRVSGDRFKERWDEMRWWGFLWHENSLCTWVKSFFFQFSWSRNEFFFSKQKKDGMKSSRGVKIIFKEPNIFVKTEKKKSDLTWLFFFIYSLCLSCCSTYICCWLSLHHHTHSTHRSHDQHNSPLHSKMLSRQCLKFQKNS